MQNIGLILIFGVSGIFCRYGIDIYFANWNQQGPVSTLLINILGSLIAGLIYAFGADRETLLPIQSALLIGFCGGFTTFSAYTLHTFVMLERGKVGLAVAFFVLSPVLGLLAAYIPYFIIRKLF